MVTRYTHLELNRDIIAPFGYYMPQKEVRLKYHGREVLYIVSQAVTIPAAAGRPTTITRWCPAISAGSGPGGTRMACS